MQRSALISLNVLLLDQFSQLGAKGLYEHSYLNLYQGYVSLAYCSLNLDCVDG